MANNSKIILVALSAAVLLPMAAFAGECPKSAQGKSLLDGAPSAAFNLVEGVADKVNLENEMGIMGKDLRLRQVIFLPQGVGPAHSHVGRPALMYVVFGELTEYRSDCGVPIIHRAGEIINDAGSFSHWWKNTGNVPAIVLSTDIVPAK